MKNRTLTHIAARPVDQAASFRLNEQSLQQVSAALCIAMGMRESGDGAVEDAARAIYLLVGASFIDDDWFKMVAIGDDDRVRQEDAYLDGVAELQEYFSPGRGRYLLH